MLTDELNELLEVTKDGILQMRKMFRNKSGEIIESLRIAPETFDNITFKKKKNECKTERAIKVIQDTPKKEKQKGGTSKRL
ncbi:MAG: hypothetical protein KDK61_02910 [Simkania sp.]|nr:hypothetical protein [Simkania sp.]